jgi:hypothetical protein
MHGNCDKCTLSSYLKTYREETDWETQEWMRE